MPKMKTKSSAKKRFKLTATGKIKRKHAFKNHILTKKSKHHLFFIVKMIGYIQGKSLLKIH